MARPCLEAVRKNWRSPKITTATTAVTMWSEVTVSAPNWKIVSPPERTVRMSVENTMANRFWNSTRRPSEAIISPAGPAPRRRSGA